MAKLTFNEKLRTPGDLPKIEDLSAKPELVKRHRAETMLVASPMQYNEIMEQVPCGKVITSEILRQHLAKKAGAGTTCPLTAGIFINICANAAIERGDTSFPWWRTLKAKGELNEKYPGGINEQKLQLEAEGFDIFQKGKSLFVRDFENYLWEIEA